MTETTERVCDTCGSANIWADAVAKWNGTDWQLSSVMDHEECEDCGGSCNSVTREEFERLQELPKA